MLILCEIKEVYHVVCMFTVENTPQNSTKQMYDATVCACHSFEETTIDDRMFVTIASSSQ